MGLPLNAMVVWVGAGMIDDFRLWGSSRCRRMGEYSTETRLFTWMVHTFDNHNASLSEAGAPSPLWYGTFPKHLIRSGTTRISRFRYRQAKRGCASRVPPSPGVTARRTRGMLVVGATPVF